MFMIKGLSNLVSSTVEVLSPTIKTKTEAFRDHWAYIKHFYTVREDNLDHEKIEWINYTNIPYHLKSMLKYLIVEDIDDSSIVENFQVNSCFEFLLEENAFEFLVEKFELDNPIGVNIQVLKFFITILNNLLIANNVEEDHNSLEFNASNFLPESKFLKPLLKLLSLCSLINCGTNNLNQNYLQTPQDDVVSEGEEDFEDDDEKLNVSLKILNLNLINLLTKIVIKSPFLINLFYYDNSNFQKEENKLLKTVKSREIFEKQEEKKKKVFLLLDLILEDLFEIEEFEVGEFSRLILLDLISLIKDENLEKFLTDDERNYKTLVHKMREIYFKEQLNLIIEKNNNNLTLPIKLSKISKIRYILNLNDKNIIENEIADEKNNSLENNYADENFNNFKKLFFVMWEYVEKLLDCGSMDLKEKLETELKKFFEILFKELEDTKFPEKIKFSLQILIEFVKKTKNPKTLDFLLSLILYNKKFDVFDQIFLLAFDYELNYNVSVFALGLLNNIFSLFHDKVIIKLTDGIEELEMERDKKHITISNQDCRTKNLIKDILSIIGDKDPLLFTDSVDKFDDYFFEAFESIEYYKKIKLKESATSSSFSKESNYKECHEYGLKKSEKFYFLNKFLSNFQKIESKKIGWNVLFVSCFRTLSIFDNPVLENCLFFEKNDNKESMEKKLNLVNVLKNLVGNLLVSTSNLPDSKNNLNLTPKGESFIENIEENVKNQKILNHQDSKISLDLSNSLDEDNERLIGSSLQKEEDDKYLAYLVTVEFCKEISSILLLKGWKGEEIIQP
ncbi:hypothetical protein HK099_001910 [Clydaea vesicula]|uniref:Uncharacterized protein n=1 Tax=Clydaea vesicula TaxID=447962 RepID=A0AAD5XYZ3_9FUNG|nr:hypothetical protein HK099_001910 [Clydaea vesicula]